MTRARLGRFHRAPSFDEQNAIGGKQAVGLSVAGASARHAWPRRVPQLTVIDATHLGPMLGLGIGTNGPSLRSVIKTLEGLTMNPILFLSLVIILSAALPWWPYSAYGRSRHRRPWDWLLDTPSREDYRTWQETHALDKNAYETKIFNQRDEAQSYTGRSQKADEAMRWHVENSPDEGDATLLGQFKERWIEAESNRSALSPTV